MSLEEAGAIAEIVGALAVVFTLIYLSIQIRESSKTNRLVATQSLLERSTDVWAQGLYVPEARALRQKFSSGESLTDAEKSDIRTLILVLLNNLQVSFLMGTEKLISNTVFDTFRERAITVKKLPHFDEIWDATKNIYTVEFQQWMDSLESSSMVVRDDA